MTEGCMSIFSSRSYDEGVGKEDAGIPRLEIEAPFTFVGRAGGGSRSVRPSQLNASRGYAGCYGGPLAL